MIKTENECVGCPQGMGCVHCSYSRVIHLICDNCDNEAEKLYDTDDGQLCEDCLKEMFTEINVDNAYEFTSPEEQDDYANADRAYERKKEERWEDEHGG